MQQNTIRDYQIQDKTTLTLDATALDERIAREADRTAADRIVVDRLAACVRAASARTRIHALLLYAGAILFAGRTDNALRSAVGCAANVPGQAGADSVTVYRAALAVRTAWRRIARIDGFDVF